MKLDKTSEAIWNIHSYIHKYGGYEKQFAIVTGEAGTGKSHLLANAIERALARKQSCLLLAGEQFLTGTPPLEQLCQCLGWKHGIEALLGALDTEAIINRKPAVIAIDALNESNERNLWKSHLISMAEIIQRYPNIKLLVSCRSDFAPFVLPEPLVDRRDEKWEFIEHTGFDTEVFKAIEVYFNGYNIQCDHFPPLLEEFGNPLFLKTFCEAYQGKSIPKGTISFDTVMKERVRYCQEMISNAIDCPAYKTKDALDLIASKIAENNGSPILHSSLRPMIDALFSGGGESKSLYIHLRSNGMLVETLRVSTANDEDPEIMIRFPYERLSDYFIASRLLNTFEKCADLKEAWANKKLPDSWIQDWQSIRTNRGMLRMMAILIPERFGCEFIELFTLDQLPVEIFEDFLVSLQWRTEASITNTTEKLLARCSEFFGDDEYCIVSLRDEEGCGVMKLLKTICVFLSVLGLVRLERLAWEAIQDAFSWCGTPQLRRGTEAILYYLLVPVVVFCLIKCWKKKSILDSIVRIAVAGFLGALMIYWYFESFFNYCWIAYW